MQTGSHREAGFTYLLLLIWISILALMLLRSSEHLHNRWRQQQEAQLLFAGDAIRAAIAHYRDYSQPNGCFPTSVQQLLRDERGGQTRHLLRRDYPDPLTGKPWEKIYDNKQRWIGVQSKAHESPLKKSGFPARYKSFEKAASYSEWQFKVAEDPRAPIPTRCTQD